MSTEPAYLRDQETYNEEQNRQMNASENNERKENKESAQSPDSMPQTHNEINTTPILSDDDFDKSKEFNQLNSAETDVKLDDSNHLSFNAQSSEKTSFAEVTTGNKTMPHEATSHETSAESPTAPAYEQSAVAKSAADFDTSSYSNTSKTSSFQLPIDNKEDFELKNSSIEIATAATIKPDEQLTDHFKRKEFEPIEEKENYFSAKYAAPDQSFEDESNAATERSNRADYRAEGRPSQSLGYRDEGEYSFPTKTESLTNESNNFFSSADKTDYSETTEIKTKESQLTEMNRYPTSTSLAGAHFEESPSPTTATTVSQPEEKIEATQEVVAEPVEENNLLTPGAYLRQAREQSNMSMQQVADRLYLDMGVIKALETDNYERLPPAIFVRGYLRNYAKLMEIAPEKIMAAHEQMVQHPHAPSILPQMKQKKQTSSNDLWFKLITLAIILTLMALMALWQFYPSSTTEPVGVNLADNAGTSNWNSFDTTSQNGYSANTQFNANNNSSMSTAAANSENQSSTASTETPAAEAPVSKTKTMYIHLRSRAWMKITDEASKKLFDGFGRGGQVLTLEGLPPFYLQVGNIDGVDVEYEGERHSIRVYPKRKGRNIYIVGGED